MHVVHHVHLPHEIVRGELRVPAADGSRGIHGFEVWVRTLDAGTCTQELHHDGEHVVLAMCGSGKLVLDGGPQRFDGPCTLVIPPRLRFQIVNSAPAPLQLVWVFTQAPTPVDG